MASQRDLDLIRASAAGEVERIRSLVGRGAKVNARLKNGATPLLAAAVAGRTDAVQLLLVQGAELKTRYKDEATVLIMASTQGHAQVVRLFFRMARAIRSGRGVGSHRCWPLRLKATRRSWRP